MFSKLIILLFSLTICSRNLQISAKPCWGTLWEELNDYFGDDSDEDDSNTTKPDTPSHPPNITVLLTPAVDLSMLQSMIAGAQPDTLYLLPSFFPLGGDKSGSTTTTSTTTTTTTTAAPPAAAPPPAAPPAAAPPAAPAANGTAPGAAPAAPGAAPAAPAAPAG